MVDGTELRDKSEFNMSISYLNRLNSLLLAADDSSIKMDINTWFNILIALFRELSTEMKPEEIEYYNKEIAEINPILSMTVSKLQKGLNRGIDSQLYMKLSNFEIKLRMVLKDSGMQMKMKEDRRFGL